MVNGQGPRVQAAQLAAVPLTGRITLAEGQEKISKGQEKKEKNICSAEWRGDMAWPTKIQWQRISWGKWTYSPLWCIYILIDFPIHLIPRCTKVTQQVFWPPKHFRDILQIPHIVQLWFTQTNTYNISGIFSRLLSSSNSGIHKQKHTKLNLHKKYPWIDHNTEWEKQENITVAKRLKTRQSQPFSMMSHLYIGYITFGYYWNKQQNCWPKKFAIKPRDLQHIPVCDKTA